MDKNEKKILESTLRFLDDTEYANKIMRRVFLNNFGYSAIILTIIFAFSSHFTLDNAVNNFLLFLSGGFFATSLIRYRSNKHWPIVSKHINRESIKNALESEET